MAWLDIDVAFTGDSNTRGPVAGDYANHRKRLYDFCQRLGITLRSRGLNSNGLWGAGADDRRHNGVSGSTIADCDAFVDARFGGGSSPVDGAGSFDFIPLQIGTVDVSGATYVQGVTITNYIALVQNILDREPSGRVLLLTIPAQSGDPPGVEQLNAEIRDVALPALRAANPSRKLALRDTNAATGGPGYKAFFFGDALHWTAGAAYQYVGDIVIDGFIELFEINMGTLSSFARTALVSHVRNKSAYTPAATHYCAAFVAGTEVTGNSYARVGLTNNKTTWSDAASRAITNDVAFTFPDATGSWGTIDEIRIYDASSGGNELGRHTLASSVPISDSTGPLTVPVGAIDITFSAGGFTNTVVHELLDLMFGATANAARATVYGTYFAGDPQGAGAETSATRTSITQATTWNAASSGAATTAAAIALADESDATHWAEYTAAAAGTLLFSAALPGAFTPPVGGIIPAGGLRTTLT